jgi:hypothetical protein
MSQYTLGGVLYRWGIWQPTIIISVMVSESREHDSCKDAHGAYTMKINGTSLCETCVGSYVDSKCEKLYFSLYS